MCCTALHTLLIFIQCKNERGRAEFFIRLNIPLIKEIVHTKMTILSAFSHLHVMLNLYDYYGKQKEMFSRYLLYINSYIYIYIYIYTKCYMHTHTYMCFFFFFTFVTTLQMSVPQKKLSHTGFQRYENND